MALTDAPVSRRHETVCPHIRPSMVGRIPLEKVLKQKRVTTLKSVLSGLHVAVCTARSSLKVEFCHQCPRIENDNGCHHLRREFVGLIALKQSHNFQN